MYVGRGKGESRAGGSTGVWAAVNQVQWNRQNVALMEYIIKLTKSQEANVSSKR